jgi:hypothetical protein
MTTAAFPLKITSAMKRAFSLFALFALLCFIVAPLRARDDDGPVSTLSFVILKNENGKPVRNAAVVLHSVSDKGKQEKGGLELKTDDEGKANYQGVPYGKIRVQVLAHGLQTYGEDYDIEQPSMEITIKLKRPEGQYSIYDDHSQNKNDQAQPKQP